MPDRDLGELQDSFTMSRRFVGSALVVTLLCLAGFLAILRLLQQPAAIAVEDRRAASILCGLCALGATYFAFTLRQHWGSRVMVFAEGMDLKMPGKHYRFRWDEVGGLALKVTNRTVNGIRANTFHEYSLQLLDARKVVVPAGLQNVEKLGERLEREIYPRAATRAFESLRRNQTVAFGPCKISNQGLEMSGTEKPWRDLEPITLAGGIFTVRKSGGQTWRVVPFGDVPNAPIFLQLSQSLRQA